VMQLVPASEAWRVDQRLRNTAELAFELHGLEFARARVGLAANSFAHTLELTVGVGASETPLTAANRVELAEKVAELFARRRHSVPSVDFGRTGSSSSRRIGSAAPNCRTPRGTRCTAPRRSAGWSPCCAATLRRSRAAWRGRPWGPRREERTGLRMTPIRIPLATVRIRWPREKHILRLPLPCVQGQGPLRMTISGGLRMTTLLMGAAA